MPFPRNLLNDHEELVLDLRPHWLYLAKSGITLAAALVLGIFVLASGPSGGFGQALRIIVGLAVLVALGWFAKVYAQWATTMFVLTTDRIVSRKGFISKQGVEIPLERVNTVFFHQGIFERMVGAGDLTIESAGERGSEAFSDIRRPSVVQKEIYVQMEENENRMRRPYYATPGPPGQDPSVGQGFGQQPTQPVQPPHQQPATVDIAAQIEKLADLHARGVLTDEEFATKKAELLGRM